MHSFLPFAHVDHTHADYILWFACASDGRKVAEDLFGDALVWIPYQRTGLLAGEGGLGGGRAESQGHLRGAGEARLPHLGRDLEGVLLQHHRAPQKAERCVIERRGKAPVLGGPKVETLEPRGPPERVLPALRGAVSQNRRWSCTWTTRPTLRVRERARQPRPGRRAACPDHLVSTKVVPYFSAWTGGSAEALREDLVDGGLQLALCGVLRALPRSEGRDGRPVSARDPRPGRGHGHDGKNKDTAIAASWLYHRAITRDEGRRVDGPLRVARRAGVVRHRASRSSATSSRRCRRRRR